MKQLLLIAVALAGITCARAQQTTGIQFEDATFQELIAKAKEQNKLVFIDFYASWCPPCKMMASQVFPQKKVGDYFNATFVNAKLDVDKGEGRTLAAKYGVSSIPTYIVFDKNGNEVGRHAGGSDADAFIAAIKKVVDQKQ